MSSHKIAIILPPREGFSPNAFGAISLTIRDFSLHSRFKQNTYTLGIRSEGPAFDDLHYEALPIRRHWYEPNTRAYLRAINERLALLEPSLVEVHNRPYIALKLAKQGGFPVALFLHNNPQEMKAARTPKQRSLLLQQCRVIYCLSEYVKMQFLDGVTDNGRIHVVHAGLNLPNHTAPKHPFILYVGRQTPNKGVLEYAQALEIVLPKFPAWQGVIVGGRRHEVSETLSDYEQDIKRVMDGIGERALMCGFLPHEETMACFRDAAIVVVPSLWDEPYGRTALEAMAHGCAVITSGRGGLAEIVGDTGILVKDVTPESLAEAITALIENPEQLSELQQRAVIRAQDFSITTCTRRFDAVRERAIQIPGRKHAA